MVAIFVALMFISLVLTDLAVQKLRAWRAVRATRTATAAATGEVNLWDWIPDGLRLADQHTWVKRHVSGGLEIGADALIARAVGAVRRILLPKEGDVIAVGQPLFRLQQNGCLITIPATVAGRVMAVNSRLAERPELLSTDPYEGGWVCRIAPTRIEEATFHLRFGEKATLWLRCELERFRTFVLTQVSPDVALGVTSQDGGMPVAGCVFELGAQGCQAFEENFLPRL